MQIKALRMRGVHTVLKELYIRKDRERLELTLECAVHMVSKEITLSK